MSPLDPHADLGLGPPDADGLTWRVDLPADPARAAERLAAADARAAALEDALAAVPDRVDAAVRLSAREHTAFDLAPGVDPTPEQTLAAALRRGRRPVDFGVTDGLSAAAKKIEARLDGLLDVARHAARVETRVGGRLVATSTLGWLGDARTLVAADAEPDTLTAHHRTVDAIARARRGRLRFVAVVVSGAARVAAAFTGGLTAALPAIYRFVDQIIDEFDALEATEAPTPQQGHPR